MIPRSANTAIAAAPGTQFGLRTGGRTRSILMSLPPLAGWRLEEEPGEGTREAELIKVLRNPVDWI